MKAIGNLVTLFFGLLILQVSAKKRGRQARVQKGSVKTDDQYEIPSLPYPPNALEPYMSQETVEIIHGKLQLDCMNNVNYWTKGNPDFASDIALVDIVQNSRDAYPLIYQNAAQSWNLAFFWDCMTEAYEDPPNVLNQAIEYDFGNFENFKKQFIDSASSIFGSGWTWLVYDTFSRRLFVTSTLGAECPYAMNENWLPILGMDVWEHAYLLDYKNRPDIYAKRFLERLVDWDQVDDNLANARIGKLNPMDDDDDDSEDDSEDEQQVMVEEEEDSGDANDNDEDDSGDEAASEL